MRYWVARAKPALNKPFADWLIPERIGRWWTKRPPRTWDTGDRLFIWASSPQQQILALGEFAGLQTAPDREGFYRYRLRYLTGVLQQPVERATLTSDPVLSKSTLLKHGPSTSVVKLTDDEGKQLYRLVVAQNPETNSVWPELCERATLAEQCIYTIKHSDELRASLAKRGTDTYSERKKWVRAKQLVEKARESGKHLPVIFAPAEGALHLFAWALLDEVFLGETTRYTFSSLRLLKPQPRKSTLRKASDGKPLDDGFIRPYAVCITPPYLEDRLGSVAETVTGEETIGPGTFPEGAVRRITVNAYERNLEARRICLKRHGVQCAACDMTFAERYGSVAQGFIHVHHLRQLSSVGSDYEVDARVDLRPVCPNCHAVIHLRTPPYSIEKVRQMISQRTTAGSKSLRKEILSNSNLPSNQAR